MMSVLSLHLSDDNIKNLMPNEQYNEIWRKIAQLPRQANGESFWQVVESLLNDNLMQLFMSAERGLDKDGNDQRPQFNYVIGLDNGKLHYNHNQNTAADGLKKGHHAKDNLRGFTSHTACHSAASGDVRLYGPAGLVCQVRWQ